MNNREGKTRIDISVGGAILLWELEEITTDILLDRVEKAIKELSEKGFYIEAHSA